jgi:hypothetical protein
VEIHNGNYSDAMKHSHESLHVFRRMSDLFEVGQTIYELGCALEAKQRFADAAHYLSEALEIFTAINEREMTEVVSARLMKVASAL